MKITTAIKKAFLPNESAAEALKEMKNLTEKDKAEMAEMIRTELGWEVEE